MKSLHPKAFWLFLIPAILGYIPFMFIITFIFYFNLIPFEVADIGSELISSIAPFSVLLGLLFLVVIISIQIIFTRLFYKSYKYKLTEDGFTKEFGFISKKYVTIPYDRIQNVDIYRGILSRILGLSYVNIQTAGYHSQTTSSGFIMGSAEGVLPGVSKEDAEKIREQLMKYIKASKSQGL